MIENKYYSFTVINVFKCLSDKLFRVSFICKKKEQHLLIYKQNFIIIIIIYINHKNNIRRCTKRNISKITLKYDIYNLKVNQIFTRLIV